MTIELRALAERILFSDKLEDKLTRERDITDYSPGAPLRVDAPVRAEALKILPAGKAKVPSSASMSDPTLRPRVIHGLANHELQAVELFAWAVLAFPDANRDFRKGLGRLIADEQRHTSMYIARLEAHGVSFGDFPVSGYFWSKVPDLRSPMEFVAAMSLTFENANLDHTDEYAAAASEAGDWKTAAVIEVVQRDEVRHVKFGFLWLSRFKRRDQDAWDAYKASLHWPLRPAKAKGRSFNRAGREQAGLDDNFIDQLESTVDAPPPVPARVIIGNLDAEHTWAGVFGDLNRPSVHASSVVSTLLAIFGRDGDHLWTLAPVDVSQSPLLPAVTFVHGDLPPKSHRLAWAETDSLPERRASSPKATHDWIDELWQLKPCPAAIAKQVNHREFSARLAEEWGVAVPGTKMASTLEAATAAIGFVGELPAHNGAWIAKAAWSAAGRHRLVHPTRGGLDNERTSRTLERLLQRGPVRIEAWLARDRDVAMVGWVDTDVHVIGAHDLLVNDRGQFQGAAPLDDSPRIVADTFQQVGQRLIQEGYRGPFGIDALRYTSDTGAHWCPLLEINARLTFGHVVHALHLRIDEPWSALHIRKGPASGLPLIEATADQPISAWLDPI